MPIGTQAAPVQQAIDPTSAALHSGARSPEVIDVKLANAVLTTAVDRCG